MNSTLYRFKPGDRRLGIMEAARQEAGESEVRLDDFLRMYDHDIVTGIDTIGIIFLLVFSFENLFALQNRTTVKGSSDESSMRYDISSGTLQRTIRGPRSLKVTVPSASHI